MRRSSDRRDGAVESYFAGGAGCGTRFLIGCRHEASHYTKRGRGDASAQRIIWRAVPEMVHSDQYTDL
jgi:hypothetical protein